MRKALSISARLSVFQSPDDAQFCLDGFFSQNDGSPAVLEAAMLQRPLDVIIDGLVCMHSTRICICMCVCVHVYINIHATNTLLCV